MAEVILFKIKHNRCPFCNYFLDRVEKHHLRWNYYCHPCDIYYQTKPKRDNDNKIDVIDMWHGHRKRPDIENDFYSFKPTVKQKQMEQDFKNNRRPAIIPDKNFHEWFEEYKKGSYL